MSNNKPKRELVGIWQVFHLIIWIGGLYYLLTRGQIFPGILVLLLISAIYEAILRRYIPKAYEEPTQEKPTSQAGIPPPVGAPNTTSATGLEHRIDLLPSACPSCNGPIRGYEVKWTGPQSADCPYCGTNLPMSKG